MASKRGPRKGPNRPAPRVDSPDVSGVVVHRETSFSGPIPDPSFLQAYNEIVPGAAERLIAMAETQAIHRQKIEVIVVRGGTRRANLGLALGFVVSMAFLAVSAWLVVSGHGLEGTVLGTFDIVGLAGVFVYGRHDQRQERESKAREMSSRKRRR